MFGFVRKRPVDELAREQARLQGQLDSIRRIQLRNANARAANMLENLQSKGIPFYAEGQSGASEPIRRTYHPVPIYQKHPKTGYPFETQIHWEQDPIFGWTQSFDDFNLDGWAGTSVPLSAFPREMYPERPTTLRTQIAQDAVRFMSRSWAEMIPQYIGPIGHLRNYIIGKGMTVSIISPTDNKLAENVYAWILEFAKANHNALYARLWDSVYNLLVDGEDFLRVSKDGEYPKLRTIDSSWVRGPHNEITGPWGYGCLTSWPKDQEDVRAFNIWWPDNTQDVVSPVYMKQAKHPDTRRNIKRGTPIGYRIRKQLPQMGKLLDCMAIGEAARQAIPYIVQYDLADKQAVRNANLEASELVRRLNPEAWVDRAFAGDGGPERGESIAPGNVHHIPHGKTMMPPPQGAVHQGTDTYRALCEAIACALNVPIWMVTGSADAENYASSLVSESPLVKNVQKCQGVINTHYEDIIKAAITIAVEQGALPANTLEVCEVHCELPSAVSRNRKDDIDADTTLMDKGVLSPQDLAARNDLDYKEQREKIKQAVAEGWANIVGTAPGERGAEKTGEEQEEPSEEQNG